MVRIPIPRPPHTGRPPGTGSGSGSAFGTAANRNRRSGDGGDNTADVAKSESKFKEFVDAANSVVGLINGLLDLASNIPFIGDIIEKIQNQLNKMFERVNEAISKTSDIFAYVGSPTTLRQTGLSWVQSVGTPSTVATSTIVPSSLPSTGSWEGKAHNAYIARVNLQQPAAEDVYNKCVMIDEQLNTYANAIVAFWVSFAAGTLTLAIAVASAVIEISSVVAAPVGIATIIVAVGGFLLEVVNMISVITTANQAVADFVMTVTNEIGSVAAYPGGAWPRHAA